MEAEGDAAMALCEQLGQPDLRSDCVVQVAARSAEQGRLQDAERYCQKSLEGRWADECWFLASDEAELVGREGREWCARTGAYRKDCLGHVLVRELAEVEGLPTELGREEELRVVLRGELQRLQPDIGPHFLRSMVRVGLSATMRQRWREQPFDASLCGQALEVECIQAYRDSIQDRVDQIDTVRACAEGAGLEEVVAAGGPGWAPGGEELARKAWSVFCRQYGPGR